MSSAWRPVQGYEGFYEVSNTGQVRRVETVVPVLTRWGHIMQVRRRGRVLMPVIDRSGYHYVGLSKGGVVHKKRVSRLVLEAFVGAAPTLEAGHKNHDVSDNRLRNLEWVTRLENEQQKTHAGRRARALKYADTQVEDMRALRAQGFSLRALHGTFNAPLTYICSVCNGKARA